MMKWVFDKGKQALICEGHVRKLSAVKSTRKVLNQCGLQDTSKFIGALVECWPQGCHTNQGNTTGNM